MVVMQGAPQGLGELTATVTDLQKKLGADLLDTLKVNWSFWPVFHVLNFRFVPPGDRILYINAVQVLYNVFLCYKASERESDDDGKT